MNENLVLDNSSVVGAAGAGAVSLGAEPVPVSAVDDVGIEHDIVTMCAEYGIKDLDTELMKNLRDSGGMSSELESQVTKAVTRHLEKAAEIGKRAAAQTVLHYIQIGQILNGAEKLFERKADFMEWLRRKFSSELGLEALRQARRIARMGAYALQYAHLGKGLLLELYYLTNAMPDVDRNEKNGIITSEAMNKLLARFPFPGRDQQGYDDPAELRTHMDALITLFRLGKKGIDENVCSFELAKMIALARTKAIEKSQAAEVSEWLAKQAEKRKKERDYNAADEDRKQRGAFALWVMNYMVPPSDVVKGESPHMRLDVLAGQLKKKVKESGENELTLGELRGDQGTVSMIKETHEAIGTLIEKIDTANNGNPAGQALVRDEGGAR